MQISLDMPHEHMITHITESAITVNLITYNTSLIISNIKISPFNYEHNTLQDLTIEELSAELHGDVLLIGHQNTNVLPLYTLQKNVYETKKMGLEIMNIGSACRTFNVLLSEKRPSTLLVIF